MAIGNVHWCWIFAWHNIAIIYIVVPDGNDGRQSSKISKMVVYSLLNFKTCYKMLIVTSLSHFSHN